MKKISAFLIIVIGFILINKSTIAQIIPMPIVNNDICYEDVFSINQSYSKTELFNKTKQWIAENFHSTPIYSPIQLEDKENGVLILHIIFNNDYPNYENINCILKIQLRDGKCKYRFNKFNLTYVYTDNNIVRKSTYGLYEHFLFNKENIAQQEKYKKVHSIMSMIIDIDKKVKNLIQELKKTINEPVIDNF